MGSRRMATVKPPGWKNTKKAKQSSLHHATARNTKMNIQAGPPQKAICKNEKSFRLWLIPLSPLLFVVLVTSFLS